MHLRPSVAISGHQWPSVALACCSRATRAFASASAAACASFTRSASAALAAFSRSFSAAFARSSRCASSRCRACAHEGRSRAIGGN